MKTRTSALLLAAVVAQSGPMSPARAAEVEWNQKQVIALAEQLVQVLGDVAAAAREAPPQATALQQRTRDAAANSFHRVREAATDYLAKLKAGRDRDMTEAHFRIVRDSFRDTRKVARDAVAAPKMDELLHKANELLSEIGRYYPDV